jgi:4-hydroxy-3-polyprenylbenzoate decarboxylase
MKNNRKIILAITGASGAIYAQRLLDKLLSLEKQPEEIAVVFSDNAKAIWEFETGNEFVAKGTTKEYNNKDFLYRSHQDHPIMIL